MKTIPTLCATSTVGVAAVGYSFAHPDNSTPTTQPRNDGKARTAERIGHQDTFISDKERPVSVGFPPGAWPENTASSRPPSTANGYIGSFERPSSSHIAFLNHLPWYSHVDSPPVAEQPLPSMDSSATLRSSRRTSWLKRLSGLSSHDSSPTSSSRPASPSIFSNGSSQPILADPCPSNTLPTGALPPNKLVKRSRSRTATGSTAQLASSGEKVPTLRRPATSHQRSATLRRLHLGDGSYARTPRHPRKSILPREHDTWRLHFRPTMAKGTKSASGWNGDSAAIRRIVPDMRNQPTLVLGDSVLPPELEFEDSRGSLDEEDEYIFRDDRPATAAGLQTFFSSADISSPIDGHKTPQRPSRRSFSITDILSSHPPSSNPSRSHSFLVLKRSKSGVGNGRRSVSAPLSPSINPPGSSSTSGTDDPMNNLDQMGSSTFSGETGDTSIDSTSVKSFKVTGRPRNVSAPLPVLGPLLEGNSGFGPSPLASSAMEKADSADLPTPPTTTSSSIGPHRISLGPSEKASTLVGSDSEMRMMSGDDDDSDFHSDTVYDSIRSSRMGTAGSVTGTPGPNIDTIVDESPPRPNKTESCITIDDSLPSSLPSIRSEMDIKIGKQLPSQSDSTSTLKPVDVESEPEDFSTPIKPAPQLVRPSQVGDHSPSRIVLPLSLEDVDWDAKETSAEDTGWSFDEDEEIEDWDLDLPAGNELPYPHSPQIQPPSSLEPTSKFDFINAPLRLDTGQGQRSARASIFEWSEQAAPFKDAQTGTVVRPSTVHGKQGLNFGTSKLQGRKKASKAHIRSQSVPSMAPDFGPNREQNTANSHFGTWGLPSKGPSEDWNDDFDFGESEESQCPTTEERRVDSGIAMFVPQAIREQQANVLGHLGHVREFALLVEDLKRLRTLALSKGIVNGPSAGLWKEAEGIINLATLDDDEQELLPPGTPADSEFDFSAFEESVTPAPIGRPRRKSVLSPDDDVFGITPQKQDSGRPSIDSSRQSITPNRPRKDSSAVARSVIETMHLRRSETAPALTVTKSQSPKKMPFDTTTLKDLVGHVNVLARNLAEVVRNAEGDLSEPPTAQDPPFSKIFAQRPNTPPLSAADRILRTKSSASVSRSSPHSHERENELCGQLATMTVN
ncbi:hypothetical protein L228DRAFT_277600 [Xylona heveae TC161]|uniref:Uncharacterized protein n=1 Tax=Xylona heveae (strain CBS 132557 / TC161) TaxID=1328760 RepID=A0A165GIV7_XYLHT|nr:hypothetical protein L228DRAFT_277600 [Xylona heveae TC161]KZF22238.1 hypothetical protein L228DRAFT_277600 [Xylona heveae TC161]